MLIQCIIQLAQEEAKDGGNDDNQNDVVIQKPHVADLRKVLQCLRDFTSCSQMEVRVLGSIAAIERHFNNAIARQTKQKTLTDFFQHV